ncbi:von Willebrand factor D and EGF domain-containing protein-like [Ptychodera flava]|uniref:von Willebrand factor D and EGF domain-containing protein-like n=1 Tax=Ptychodera flava TaxID=63121 RepID=UPI00396A059C
MHGHFQGFAFLVLASMFIIVRGFKEEENPDYPQYPQYPPYNCGDWTPCSASCGPFGRQTRLCTRENGASFTEMIVCNTLCLNGGTIQGSYCECPPSATGLCCELQADSDLSLEMVTNNNDVNFECSLSSQSASAGDTLQFRWFANDDVIFTESVTSTQLVSVMLQSSWLGKMGTAIHCEVQISSDGNVTETKRSSSYFAGVKVKGTFGEVIELSENANEYVIQLESSIPLLCDSCQISLPVFVTDRVGLYKPYPDVVVKDTCGAVVTPSNSVPGGNITLTIKARRDFFRDGDGTVYLGFLPVKDSSPALWRGYHLIHLIQVRTLDRDKIFRRCSGMGDPHYQTCDGVYYDVYKPGEYIFYKHEIYPFEIQTRLTECGSVACNCGVAVRVGDDTIIIDRCKTTLQLVVYFWGNRKYEYYRKTSQLIAKVLKRGDLTPGFRLIKENSGRTFKIFFPNGAYVAISGEVYLGVYYSPGSDDYGFLNAGFCGNCDEDAGNDLRHGPFKTKNNIYSQSSGWGTKHDFSETWRTPEGKNLFYGELDDIEDIETETNQSYTPPQEYCTCTPTGLTFTLEMDFNEVTVDEQCGYTQDRARSHLTRDDNGDENNCDSKYCDVTDDYLEEVDDDEDDGDENDDETGKRRRKRANDDETNDLSFSFNYDFEPSVPTWPTESGITEANATSYCEALLKDSPAGVACSNAISDDDMNTFMETCKTDIKVLDSLEYGDPAGELMKGECRERLTKDTSLWTPGADGLPEPPLAILSILCPSDCNGKGVCTGGQCVCDDGFAGTDCSVDLSVEPTVYMAHKNGLCDVKTDDCTYVSVFGDNFAESDQLTCHINTIEVSSTGFTKTETSRTEGAVFVSFEEVKCTTRSNRRRRDSGASSTQPSGSLISISNDGQLVSAELLVIIFNPNCDVCNGTEGYCVRRADVCEADGDCYDKGHPKCSPNQLIYILVGAILGGLVVIIIIIIIIVVVKKKMARNAKVSSSDLFLK